MKKEYVLAAKEARKSIDLGDYANMIANAVLGVMDEDDIVVYVCKDGYYMDALASKEEEGRIEEILCNSVLGKYRSQDGNLFTSIEIDDSNDVAN